jgi:hypothetical protein
VGGQPLPIDLVAGGVVLGVTLLLVAGVREASWVNTATTSVVVLVIIFTIIAGGCCRCRCSKTCVMMTEERLKQTSWCV